ncbi:MAG: thioredoxin family protein [Clostridia bacterium]
MALFGFGKKKEETKTACSCGGKCNAVATESEASVKVLGGGCDKCNQLEQATVEALAELGMDKTIEHVTDFAIIAGYGVMTTPALVVDDKVVSYGKVLKKEEVIAILKKVRP